MYQFKRMGISRRTSCKSNGSVPKKLEKKKFTVMVRHNLGLLYAGQNMSELAIRYLSEVSEKKPNHYKAIFIEGREHSKLGNQETANTLFERGLQLCTELNNEEYQHRFKILRDINNNVPAEKIRRYSSCRN